MPDEPDPLQSLIADILEAEFRGEPVDRDAFVNQHPEHADSLLEFFANHDSMKGGSHREEATLPPASSPAVEDATLPPSTNRMDDVTLPPRDEEATMPPGEAPSPGTASVGDKVRYFGDYELLEEIARGGMGVVYKARQINLNRIVALKMILSGQLAGEEDVKRFYTEAEAAASLDHPGIVPIFEVGQHQGQHYFSMGFIEGQSLAQKVADGPLPPREAAELVQKICEAMAYAHERGVIHRDLKPANILIDQNGQPKVTDFGLAKRLEADSNLTGTGQILGTPSYMAPEQASGKVQEIGPLADVYALGAILYCLLTGRPPFQAANPMDTLLQVLSKEPLPPRQIDPSIPRDLDTLVLKCLEKAADRRYTSPTQVASELQCYVEGRPIQARPVSALNKSIKWAKRKPLVAGLCALLLLVTVVGLSVSTLFAVAAIHQRNIASANLYAARIYMANRAGKDGDLARMRRLLEQQIPASTGSTDLRDFEWYYLYRQLSGRKLNEWISDAQATISGFGDLAAYCKDNQIQVLDLATEKVLTEIAIPGGTYRQAEARNSQTGEVKTINASNIYGVDFGQRDAVLAIAMSGGIHFHSVETGEKVRPMIKEGGSVLGLVELSDSGRYVAYEMGSDYVKLWDLQSETNPVSIYWRYVRDVTFDASESVLAIAGADGIALHSLPSGERIRELKLSQGYVSGLSFLPDGDDLISYGSEVLRWKGADAPPESLLDASFASISGLTFDQDAKKLAVATGKSIRIIDFSSKAELTAIPVERGLTSLAFGDNGHRVAAIGSYDIDANGSSFRKNKVVEVWDVGSSSFRSVKFDTSEIVRSFSCSPNGKLIIARSQRLSNQIVLPEVVVSLIDTKTGERVRELSVQAANFGGRAAECFSQDATWLAFSSSTTEHQLKGIEIHRLDAAEEPPSILTIPEFQHQSIESYYVIRDLEISPDSNAVTAAFVQTESRSESTQEAPPFSRNAMIVFWDRQSGKVLKQQEIVASGPIVSLDLELGGNLAASASADGTVAIWNLNSGKRLLSNELDRPCQFVRISPNQERFAIVTDKMTEVRDVSNGRLVVAVENRGQVAFNREATRLFAARNQPGLPPEIVVFDLATGEELLVLPGHTHAIEHLEMYADGSVLVSAGGNELLFWESSFIANGLDVRAPLVAEHSWADRKQAREDAEKRVHEIPDRFVQVVQNGRLSQVFVERELEQWRDYSSRFETSLLQHADPLVRIETVRMLGRLGQSYHLGGIENGPLVTLIKDSSEAIELRREAMYTVLVTYFPHELESIFREVSGLEDVVDITVEPCKRYLRLPRHLEPGAGPSLQVVAHIASLGPAAVECLPELEMFLDHGSTALLVPEVVKAIAKIGQDDSVEVLKQAALSPHREVRNVAVNELTALGASSTEDGTGFSGWLSVDRFREHFQLMTSRKMRPLELEGRSKEGVHEYRVKFVPNSSGLSWFARRGISDQSYENFQKQYLVQGFTEIWHQSFTDRGGETIHSAIWVRSLDGTQASDSSDGSKSAATETESIGKGAKESER